MILNIEGCFSLLIYNIIKIINKNLLKNTNKNYHGFAIGKALFEKFNDYIKENNILNFYLYADTYCNYKFYEHLNMNKKAEERYKLTL